MADILTDAEVAEDAGEEINICYFLYHTVIDTGPNRADFLCSAVHVMCCRIVAPLGVCGYLGRGVYKIPVFYFPKSFRNLEKNVIPVCDLRQGMLLRYIQYLNHLEHP